MIIQKTNDKIKTFTQKIYDAVVNSLDLSLIKCPHCHHNKWHYHGNHDRSAGLFCYCKIRVTRIKCANCDKTHVILVQDMIPFSSLNHNDIIFIMQNNDAVSASHLYFLKTRYLPIINFSYEYICSIKSRNYYFILIPT